MTSSDKKWQKVEPGHLVPAGQPFAKKYATNGHGITWAEFVNSKDLTLENSGQTELYIDSTWVKPVDLPKVWTFGIVLFKNRTSLYGKFRTNEKATDLMRWGIWSNSSYSVDKINRFIPLTEDQTALVDGWDQESL